MANICVFSFVYYHICDRVITWIYSFFLYHHKEAEGRRGRLFPLYEKLLSIFGTDRVTGRYAETPADMVDEMECNDTQSNDLEVEEESELFTIYQTSSASLSRSSRLKRKRQSDNISDGLKKLAKSLDKMMDKSNM